MKALLQDSATNLATVILQIDSASMVAVPDATVSLPAGTPPIPIRTPSLDNHPKGQKIVQRDRAESNPTAPSYLARLHSNAPPAKPSSSSFDSSFLMFDFDEDLEKPLVAPTVTETAAISDLDDEPDDQEYSVSREASVHSDEEDDDLAYHRTSPLKGFVGSPTAVDDTHVDIWQAFVKAQRQERKAASPAKSSAASSAVERLLTKDSTAIVQDR